MPPPVDFSFAATKDGRVRILWQGKYVVTLAGPRAQRFLAEAEGLGEEGRQLLMARCTGNFRRGNERRSTEKR